MRTDPLLRAIDKDPFLCHTLSSRKRTLAERLLYAAKIMGIDVIDHIIVGRNGHFSFQAAGLIKQ